MKVPISLVCCTHNGKKKIPKLINSIIKNNHQPKEIIICGTSMNDVKNLNKKKNIKFLLSPIANQVYQRNLAIKKSKYELIIQCDDDIILEKSFIKKMYNHFKSNPFEKKIVSASIYTKNNLHQSIRWNNLYNKNYIFKFLINFLNGLKDFNYMSILSSGRIAPRLPFEYLKNNKRKKKILENNEWLCSTICYNKKYYKSDNSLKNYQKSFFEDVIFTHKLFKKKFNLILDPNIVAYHPYKKPSSFVLFLKTLPVQLHIVKKFDKSLFLFILDIMMLSFLYIFNK